MRYISIKDNETGHVKIRCVKQTAKLLGVSRITLYRWEEKGTEKKYGKITLNFFVDIPVSLRTIR